ncbi:MAG TPA: hypothetical protein DCZ51_10065 [Bacteroidales bacterium]|jgi:hypothetical protein|nr:hypothetical protein [Bacteroidales bacterium]
MNRKYYLAFITIYLLIININPGFCQSYPKSSGSGLLKQDTIVENQILYNGRIWHNLFPLIQDNQFLFSKEFLPASVTIRGRTFPGIMLKYDIFTDEIITPFAPAGMLQLNKLLIDSFSIVFQNKNYHFLRITDGNTALPGGYYNVVYKGKATLYARYSKKIEKLADNNELDKFYQINRIYLEHKGNIYNILGKNDLFRVLDVKMKDVRQFMRENNNRISNEDPSSYLPFLRYHDDLKEQDTL